MAPWQAHVLYALAWLSFGAGHSLLAAEGVKGRLGPLLGPWYRLAYNGLAASHVALVWLVGRWAFAGTPAYDWGDGPRMALMAIYVLGWILMIVGLRGYDLGRLLGTTQVRNHRAGIAEPEDEPLRTDGLHAFIRHPLYSAAFLILFGRIGAPFDLATAVWGTLYLLVGSTFEERRLLRLYGDAYARYRRAVPAFVPWRGRALTPGG